MTINTLSGPGRKPNRSVTPGGIVAYGTYAHHGWAIDRVGDVIRMRPQLAAERPGSYVALPASVGHGRVLVWEIGKPGIVRRGDLGADRLPIEVDGHEPLRFVDREAAEDLAAALTAGRKLRGVPEPAQQPQVATATVDAPGGPWWRFWG